MPAPTFLDLVIGSIPLLMFFGFFYAVLTRVTPPRKIHLEKLEEMRKQNALLERIAASLDAKAK